MAPEPPHSGLAKPDPSLQSANGNLESQKNFLKKIGLNFRLAAKTLHFDYALPRRLVAAAADFNNWGGFADDFRTACKEFALAA